MTTELRMLCYSTLLGLAYMVVAAILGTQQRGIRWNVGNRDGEARTLTGVAARAARANANFLETFPFFVAATLAVVVARQNTPHTALGAELYCLARLLYLPIYLIGIPYLRTLVWVVAVWGILQIVGGLL